MTREMCQDMYNFRGFLCQALSVKIDTITMRSSESDSLISISKNLLKEIAEVPEMTESGWVSENPLQFTKLFARAVEMKTMVAELGESDSGEASSTSADTISAYFTATLAWNVAVREISDPGNMHAKSIIDKITSLLSEKASFVKERADSIVA